MVRWFLALLVVFSAGCAKKSDGYTSATLSGGYGGGGGGYREESVMAEADSGPALAKRSGKAGGGGRSYNNAPAPPPPPPAARPAPSPGFDDGIALDDGPITTKPETAEPETPARMVHYDGFARIRVTKPEDLLEAAEAIAKERGGRVDRLSGNTISLRVPVADFPEAWEACLALGDVLDQTVRADDITEQFLAVDLRVKTLTETRNRLIELIAKATEEQEKLQLLAQLTRVNEELDGYASQKRALADLAAFSRINLEAVARQAFTGTQRPELDGMRWISQLSPFRRAIFDDDKRIELPEPAGLVALSKKGPFAAESPDGTVLWTLRLPNDPQGDGEFWVGALNDRLAESFADVSKTTLGSWSCLVLNEAGADAPYQWQVCVRPDGKHLQVGQVFYPSPEQVDRYGTGVEGAFKAGGDS